MIAANNVEQFPSTHSSQQSPLPAVVRAKELANLLGLSRSGIYTGVKSGVLPMPIKLGKRALGWRRADVLHLLEHGATLPDTVEQSENNAESISASHTGTQAI